MNDYHPAKKHIEVSVGESVRILRELLQGLEGLGADGSYELKESQVPYKGILGHENDFLRPENG